MKHDTAYRGLRALFPDELLEMEDRFPCQQEIEQTPGKHSALEKWVWDVTRIWKLDMDRGARLLYSDQALVEYIALVLSRKGITNTNKADIKAMVNAASAKIRVPYDGFQQVAEVANRPFCNSGQKVRC